MTDETRRALWTSALFGTLFAAVLALALARGPAAETETRTSALPVEVVEIRLSDELRIAERLAGRVVSRRRSELGFERGGRLEQVWVDAGARVEAGETLAQLDTRDLEAARRELAARVEATRARWSLARATVARQRELSRSDFLSKQDLDEAIANEAALEAQLGADGAALERTAVAIELSRLDAPYDAVVVERLADEGNIMGSGQAVLRILEDGVQEVHLGVPPQLTGRLEIGRTYRVQSATSELSAVLRSIVPELDRQTRTQTAILEIADPVPEDPSDASNATAVDARRLAARELSEGTLVWLELERILPMSGAWLPIGALAEGRRGTWTAFAVVGDVDGLAVLERRQVEILHTEETRAFVRGTLRDGDRIVGSGLHRLVSGLAVEIVGDVQPVHREKRTDPGRATSNGDRA